MNEEQSSYRIFLKFLPALIFCIGGIALTIYLLYRAYIDSAAALQIFGIIAVMTLLYIGIIMWRLSRSLKK